MINIADNNFAARSPGAASAKSQLDPVSPHIDSGLCAGIYTLGCKVNQYESQAISETLSEYGIKVKDFSERCDIYIINTCTVTSESDRKSGQMVRRAAAANPNAVIIVTGCSSELDPERYKNICGVDFICGTGNKLNAVKQAAEYALRGQKNAFPVVIGDTSPTSEFEKMTVHSAESGRTRAYVKIEDGCESRCAYCIIPKVRGPIRSKPLDEAIAEITCLAKNGCKEIVLTGIETSAYEFGLETLLEKCENIPGLDRIRMGSLDPSLLRPDFVDKISRLTKPVPHFHLSLQSGCDKTLAGMRRKYNTRMIEKYVGYIRENIPNATFTADIIVGFPGETDEDYTQSESFLSSLGLLYMHIFTYSPRPGTEAAEMDGQVPESVKKLRSEKLLKAMNESRGKVIKPFVEAQTVFPVLFESASDGFISGHTPNFLEVFVRSDEKLNGKILNVKLLHYKDGKIYGECIS